MKHGNCHQQPTTNNQRKLLVSVIMPVRNGSVFMDDAIKSILNQTYKNFELLIIDDASNDQTWETMQAYRKQSPKKIRLFRSTVNLGAFAAANIAVKKAKGKYIAPMDSDDISKPTRLEKQVIFMEKNPDVILSGSNAEIIDQNGLVTGYKKYASNHNEIYKQMSIINPIVHPSCIIRKSKLPDKNKLYLTEYGVNSDYYTFFALLNSGRFANLKENLLSYRIHGKNSSLINLKAKFFNTLKIRIKAVKTLGYRMPVSAYPVLLIQTAIVSLIPGKLLLPVYLILRGIKQTEQSPQMGIKNTLFSRIKYALSMM